MDLRPTCEQCHCAMDMANIRANPEGSGFVCRTCLENKTGKESINSTGSSGSKEIFSKKSYLCEDCGYTFERNATFEVSDCPMCAKVNVNELIIEPKEISTESTPLEQTSNVIEEKDWIYQ